MKKLFVTLFALGFGINALASSVEGEKPFVKRPATAADKKVELRVNPVGALLMMPSGELNMRLTDNVTVGLRGTYAKAKIEDKFSAKGYSAGAQVLYFPGSNQEAGMFFGATAAMEDLEIHLQLDPKKDATNVIRKGLAATGKLGYQWTSNGTFVMSSDIELGMHSNFKKPHAEWNLLNIGIAV